MHWKTALRRYKQQLWLLPYKAKSYVKVVPKDVGIKKEIYEEILKKGIELNNQYAMVRWMIMKVKNKT